MALSAPTTDAELLQARLVGSMHAADVEHQLCGRSAPRQAVPLPLTTLMHWLACHARKPMVLSAPTTDAEPLQARLVGSMHGADVERQLCCRATSSRARLCRCRCRCARLHATHASR